MRKNKGACTHTGFLPESDPAPVVEIFTRTGITAAGGQFDIEGCTLKITLCRFHTEVFKTVARHRQVQISRTKKMFVHRNRKRKLQRSTLKLISRTKKMFVRRPACRVPVRHTNLPGRQTRPDRLRVKKPIYLHCIRRWSRTRLRFCRCVCRRPKAVPSFRLDKEVRTHEWPKPLFHGYRHSLTHWEVFAKHLLPWKSSNCCTTYSECASSLS